MFSGLDSGGSEERRMESYRRLEDLVVYQTYEEVRARYPECIRMLNGMERTLEKQLPELDRRWPQSSVREDGEDMAPALLDFLNPGLPNPGT